MKEALGFRGGQRGRVFIIDRLRPSVKNEDLTPRFSHLRKNRNGAFWEDRYHATAVQTNKHLIKCITYIDLNMVRAGVAKHCRRR